MCRYETMCKSGLTYSTHNCFLDKRDKKWKSESHYKVWSCFELLKNSILSLKFLILSDSKKMKNFAIVSVFLVCLLVVGAAARSFAPVNMARVSAAAMEAGVPYAVARNPRFASLGKRFYCRIYSVDFIVQFINCFWLSPLIFHHQYIWPFNWSDCKLNTTRNTTRLLAYN